MNIRTLVWQEIAHRKLNFAIGLVAVAAAAAGSVGVVTLLKAYQLQTTRQLAAEDTAMQAQLEQFQAQHKQHVDALDKEIRKITVNLGFNLLILPADENLTDYYAADFAEKTMPEEFVTRMAKSRDLVTIAHLRPALVRKIDWPEQKRQLLLMGVAGVAPQANRGNEKSLAEPVPPGTINLGSELAKDLSLKPNSEVTIRGEKFRVGKVYPPRGNKDDITAWIDLATAQKMAGLPGRINLMQALECNCARVDRLGDIQKDLARVLGGKVQVIELSTKAIARAKARNEVQAEGIARLASIRAEGETTLEKTRADGAAVLGRLERFSAVVLPLVIAAACLMVGLVSLMNVRERRGEIGILRALGTRSGQIFTMFVARAAVLGLLGAALGYAGGFFGAAGWDALAHGAAISNRELFVPGALLGVVALGPLLAIIAGSLPATLAASQDPAVALRESGV